MSNQSDHRSNQSKMWSYQSGCGLISIIFGLNRLLAGLISLIHGLISFIRDMISLISGLTSLICCLVSLIRGLNSLFTGVISLIHGLISFFNGQWSVSQSVSQSTVDDKCILSVWCNSALHDMTDPSKNWLQILHPSEFLEFKEISMINSIALACLETFQNTFQMLLTYN